MGFFGSLTGSSQRRDINRANRSATNALNTAYTAANQAYDTASGLFDPYVQAGAKGQDTYNALLGLNGSEARATAQNMITSDPLWSGKLAQDQNAILAYQNARGDAGGGRAYAAGQRSLLDNYGNWLDRYQSAGRQGFEATGSKANIGMAKGDMAMGYGATKAGQAINYGNAMAQSRGIGVNNLMGLLGTGLKAYSTFSGGGR